MRHRWVTSSLARPRGTRLPRCSTISKGTFASSNSVCSNRSEGYTANLEHSAAAPNDDMHSEHVPPPLKQANRAIVLPTKRRGRPPKVYSEPLSPGIVVGSENHNDTASFLAYADRIGLDKSSTVYNGTLYEYRVLDSLQRLQFDLTRIGRGSDRGIDLLGHWSLPDAPAKLPVLVQCKLQTGTNKSGPAFMRELEGTFLGAPSGWRGKGVMAMLATTREATKGVREAMMRSRWPMGYLTVTAEGSIQQFIWNHLASQIGLSGMGATLRHSVSKSRPMQEVVLTWQDRPWPK